MKQRRKKDARPKKHKTQRARRALNALGAMLCCAALMLLTAPRALKQNEPTPSAAPVTVAVEPVDVPIVDIAPIITPAPSPVSYGDRPLILIYHTHTTEAYAPTERYNYEDDGDSRTRNNEMNIVAVGKLLADTLQNTYGIPVIHDITNHEPPALKSAYTRSLKTMLKYRDEYPSLVMYIDVHRDAGSGPDFVTVNGVNCAKLMFVVGTGKGATGSGYDEMPNFESNYAIAAAVTSHLNGINADLTREIRVKTGRYNQHVADCCLLVEVGHNGNTLEEALASIPLLAEAIAANLDIAAPIPLTP